MCIYLPDDDPPLLRPEEEHVALQEHAPDAVRKRHHGLLVPARPGVHVDGGLLVLGGEHVGFADGEAVARDGALLEGARRGVARVERVLVYAGVFGDGRVIGQRRPGDGREIAFRQHFLF